MEDRALEKTNTLNSLSIKELRNILVERNVDFSDCFEKGDLVRRVIETEDRHTSTQSPQTQKRKEKIVGGVLEWSEKIAGLDCVGLEQPNMEGNPQLLVVVCHGFGANKEDLVPIGRNLLTTGKIPFKIQMVFPDGFLSLGGESKAWFNIDVNDIIMSVMQGNVQKIFSNQFNGELEVARKKVTTMIEELKKRTGLPTSRVLLCGFSQGAMLSTDIAYHLDENPAGLCIFSGMLINQEAWKANVDKRKNLKVVQCHGKRDNVLPYQLALVLKEFFEKQSVSYEFVPFDGAHSIDYVCLKKFQDLILSADRSSL